MIKSYITWSPVSGATGYYIYRFEGTLDDVWQYYDEIWEPEGTCISSSNSYPLSYYAGSTDHFTLIGDTADYDIPPYWNRTYFIDQLSGPGQYIYLVRSHTDLCVGPISDPITLVVASAGCPDDEDGRPDSAKWEGTFLESKESYERVYGIPVRAKEVTLESTFSSRYNHLFYVYGDDPMDGDYVYVPPYTTTLPYEIDVLGSYGSITIESVPYDDWLLLYNDGDIEWEPIEPGTFPEETGFVSVDVRYLVFIESLPSNIWDGITQNVIIDSKHIEGTILPGSLLLGRLYPGDVELNSILFHTTYPTVSDMDLTIGTESVNEDITIPTGTKTFTYIPDVTVNEEELEYIPVDYGEYLYILANTVGGVSMDIAMDINMGISSEVCVPYSCIDFHTVWFEGHMMKETEEIWIPNRKGAITRTFAHSGWPNTLTEDTIIRIKNNTTLQYIDINVEPGEHMGFSCGRLLYMPGDIISIVPISDTTLVSVNVHMELWNCGFYLSNSDEYDDIVFDDYVFTDGWVFEGGTLSYIPERFRTYDIWTKLKRFVFNLKEPVTSQVNATLYLDGVETETFAIPVGETNIIVDDLDISIAPSTIISMKFDDYTKFEYIVVRYGFSVPNSLNISMADPTSWIRDQGIVDDSGDNTTYNAMIYGKDGYIGEIYATSDEPVAADTIVYLENLSDGGVLACMIASGTNKIKADGNLTFEESDIIALKCQGSGQYLNVYWKVYTDDSEILCEPKDLDFTMAHIKSRTLTQETIWDKQFSTTERLRVIEISMPSLAYNLNLELNVTGYPVPISISLPSGTTHYLDTCNYPIASGSTLSLDGSIGDVIPDMDLNLYLVKTP